MIHKTSRSPTAESYSGGTWDTAGLRKRHKKTYASRAEAEGLAARLSEHNLVGFQVSEAPSPEPVYQRTMSETDTNSNEPG